MLTHRLPPELAKIDATDRENWVVAAALAFKAQNDPTTLALIVAAGEDEFLRVARIGFHGQDFTQGDLKRIFAILTYEVARQPRIHHGIHG